MRQVVIHYLARTEIAQAMRYYEAQRQGLGLEFASDLDLAVERIQLNPEAGPPLSAKERRRLLDRFPYSIIYTLPPDRIRVIAVMHTSRRPDYWAARR